MWKLIVCQLCLSAYYVIISMVKLYKFGEYRSQETTPYMKSKRITVFIITAFIAMLLPLTMSAQNDVIVAIDDVTFDFQNMGARIVQNHTFAPARPIFEAIGFEVEWYGPEQRVTFTRDDYILNFTVGSYYFTTNDVVHSLEAPVQIISNTAFLQLRTPLESVGYHLGWNANTRTVLIITTGELPEPTAEELEWQVFVLTNMERESKGIDPLAWNDQLGLAARLHSEDMSENAFMSHTGSDGSTPADRLARIEYNFSHAAENVARGHLTPEHVVEAWMDSEGHKRNILDPYLEEIGVGFSNFAWTQKFGTQW